MSLMIVSSESPLSRMVAAKSRCSSLSGVSSSNPLMPMTAFIGVRISWLIVARKALLASLAASAAARASWVCRNSVLFWIAMAACPAKVSSSAASFGSKPSVRLRDTTRAPTARPSPSMGTTIVE